MDALFNLYEVTAWHDDWADDEQTWIGRSGESRVVAVPVDQAEDFLESLDRECDTLKTLAVGVTRPEIIEPNPEEKKC